MILATDLMINNWVRHGDLLNMKVVTIVPKYIDGDFKWLVNGMLEEKLKPIPLTPDLMERIGWEKRQDHESVLGYATQNNYWLGWVRDNPGPFKRGDIIVGAEMKIITYLHELQNTYRWDTGKPLEVSL